MCLTLYKTIQINLWDCFNQTELAIMENLLLSVYMHTTNMGVHYYTRRRKKLMLWVMSPRRMVKLNKPPIKMNLF